MSNNQAEREQKIRVRGRTNCEQSGYVRNESDQKFRMDLLFNFRKKKYVRISRFVTRYEKVTYMVVPVFVFMFELNSLSHRNRLEIFSSETMKPVLDFATPDLQQLLSRLIYLD